MPPDISCLYKSRAGCEAMIALYDRTLAKCTVLYESHFVPTRHGDTNLVWCGNLAPAGPSAWWECQCCRMDTHFAAFSPHFRVVARARELVPQVIAEIDPEARHGFPQERMDTVIARSVRFLKERA